MAPSKPAFHPQLALPGRLSPTRFQSSASVTRIPASLSRRNPFPAPKAAAPLLSQATSEQHLARKAQQAVSFVKVSALYCPSSRGSTGPFRKVVAAYAEEPISFVEPEFTTEEDFTRHKLGVTNLPFFSMYRGDCLIDATPIS